MSELSFGQRIDPANRLIEPWFTHGALDEIKTWDMSDKNILMFGAGMGDRWLASKCKSIYVVERKEEWYVKGLQEIQIHNVENITYLYRPCNDGSGSEEYYCEIPEGLKIDIIIVDDAYRYECIIKALTLKRPLILIVDNWQQDYIFICPSAIETLRDYKGKYFIQPDHKDHEGNPWQTAIWQLK